jgi:hypothetical protein
MRAYKGALAAKTAHGSRGEQTMATITQDELAPDSDDPRGGAPILREVRHDPRWALRGVEPLDIAAIKALFHALHPCNTSLDPRFALSEEWEIHFDASMERPCANASHCA